MNRHFSKAWKWGPSTTINNANNNANNASNANDNNNSNNTADASWEQRQHVHGATVIVVVNGREVPTYHVFRNKVRAIHTAYIQYTFSYMQYCA
jgi:hypothetical protein